MMFSTAQASLSIREILLSGTASGFKANDVAGWRKRTHK